MEELSDHSMVKDLPVSRSISMGEWPSRLHRTLTIASADMEVARSTHCNFIYPRGLIDQPPAEYFDTNPARTLITLLFALMTLVSYGPQIC